MKRNNLLFVVMTALFLLVSPSLWAESSGSCGDNVKWTLDDQGVLTIEGEGAMADYTDSSPSPWKDLSFTKAVIKDGVTTIGAYAFQYCGGLSSVAIPNSVTSIGKSAFDFCKGLTKVTIPSSVKNIGVTAFYVCTGLEKLECLAETPPTCDKFAFYDVDKNKCVLYVPENSISAYKAADQWKDFTKVEAWSDGTQSGTCGDNINWTLDSEGVLTFEGTGAMTNYEYGSPSPLRELSFTKAVIKDGITTIGDHVFGGCSELTSVEIPGSVTSIGECAFMGSGLTSVTIPSSVTSIKWGTFYNCEGLTSVNIHNSITDIEAQAFYNCTGLTSVAIPSSVTSIGEGAFSRCSGLESITVAPENSTYNSSNNCNAIIETNTNTLIVGCKNTSIPSSVACIGSQAFYLCTGLTSVTIPNSVEIISDYAFCECSGLTSVTIPASVMSIGDYAFCYCTGLKKIEIHAETPPACGEDVFFDDSDCVLYVPEKSIEAYKVADGWKGFTTVEALSDGTQSGTCGENVTWTLDSDGLLTITGEGAMTDYDEEFPQWRNLSPTKVVIGEGVTTIGIFAFSGCKGLTSVEIPTSVTSIGDGAFTQCTGLTKIESLAEIPPTCGGEVFIGVDKDKCELSVPWTSAEAYKAADQWKDFTNIVTGINGVAQENNAVVSASNGVITVTGTAYNAVTEVYGTNGALVYRGTGKTIAVPSAGMYIVRAAGKTVKVNTAR